jgi:hypothetical protein
MVQKRIVLLVLLLLALIVAGCSGGAEAAPGPAAAERAATWLADVHQNDDGGFTAFSTGAGQAPSDVVGTIDGLTALAAAGDATPALDYLRANGAALQAMAAADGGQAGKIVLALRAAGVDPADFAGHDYTADLAGHLGPEGAFAGDPYKHALAMLGTAAAGQTIPAAAVEWLENSQSAGGSWDDGFGTLDNADATAMAVMALLAAGRSADDTAVAAARDFLVAAQPTEGGWGYGAGLPASANSTALVIQALIALGVDPTATGGEWAKAGRSPLDALLAWQGESGAFQADFGDGPSDDFYSTVQAIPAAAGRTLPPEG